MKHLILHRRYRDNVIPFRATVNQRGSRPTTLDARQRNGGFEISVFPHSMEAFQLALKEIIASHAKEAHMSIYEGDPTDGPTIERWMLQQISLQRAKRLL